MGNVTITKWLNSHHYKYESEYSFKDFICITKPYQFDFALFNENNDLLGLIEYQGDIHFKWRADSWNTEESFIERQRRDKEKFDYCQKNNIKLYYITYLEDIEERLEEITRELYGE